MNREHLQIVLTADETELNKALKRFAYISGTAFQDNANKIVQRLSQRIEHAKREHDYDEYIRKKRDKTLTDDSDLAKKFNRLDELEKGKFKLQAAAFTVEWNKAFKEFRDSLIKTIAVGGSIGWAFLQPIKAAADFETALINVAKVYKMGNEETKAFGRSLLDLTGKLPLTSVEIGNLAYEMAQLGFAKKELPEAVELATKAHKALGVPLAEVGEILGSFKASYKLKDIQEILAALDFINEASNVISKKPPEILEAVTRFGSIAGSFGITPQTATAFASVLLNAGWKPEMVETGLKDFLVGLMTLFSTHGGAPQKSQAVNALGLNRAAYQELVNKQDFAGMAAMYFEGVKRAVAGGKYTAVTLDKLIFGQEHMSKIITLEQNPEKLLELMNKVKTKDYLGSVDEEYQRVLETANIQWQILKNNLMRVSVLLGDAILPHVKTLMQVMTKVVGGFADFAKVHPSLMGLIGDLSLVTGGLLALAGAIRIIKTIIPLWSVGKGLYGTRLTQAGLDRGAVPGATPLKQSWGSWLGTMAPGILGAISIPAMVGMGQVDAYQEGDYGEVGRKVAAATGIGGALGAWRGLKTTALAGLTGKSRLWGIAKAAGLGAALGEGTSLVIDAIRELTGTDKQSLESQAAAETVRAIQSTGTSSDKPSIVNNKTEYNNQTYIFNGGNPDEQRKMIESIQLQESTGGIFK